MSTPDAKPPSGLVSETADTIPPPPDRPSVEMRETPGWKPPSKDDEHAHIMEALSGINSKLTMLVDRDEVRARSDRQLDRLSQQMGAVASVVQTLVLERDVGNGLQGARVLIVEDDPLLGPVCREALVRRGCTIVSLVPSVDRAQQVIESLGASDAATHALVDIKLGQHYGVEIARLIRQRWPETAVILTTGFTDESIPAGVSDFELLKPFTGADLARAIEQTWRLDRPERLTQ